MPFSRLSPDSMNTGGKREKRIRRAVEAGVRQWHEGSSRASSEQTPLENPRGQAAPKQHGAQGASSRQEALEQPLRKAEAAKSLDGLSGSFPATSDILCALPGHTRLGVHWQGPVNPPRRTAEVFEVGWLYVLRRLFAWLGAALRYGGGIAWDGLRRRNTEQRRAERLRHILESMGATAVKMGQQMSMRVDLIPFAYTQELEKMLDRVPAFPVAYAIAEIEAVTGKPLAETFSLFDPSPIGSASVACVYQAVLRSGERVAVKVRRPDIGNLFASDLRVLTWVLRLAELFFLPPGFTRQLMYALETMLLEELDFVREARNTELFRQGVKKAKFRYATVPRVYFDLSGRSVLVTEFVMGIHLKEVIGAVERNDETVLAELHALGINPKKVARRALQVIRHSVFEGLVFNADPHPANILVRPKNHLVFIDFGTVGSFTVKDLYVWQRLLYAQSVGDVGNMTQATIILMEPISPIDVSEFSRKLEKIFFEDLFAFKSKHAAWWERTSANVWLKVLQLVREYQISLNLDVLRMIRATMLADSLAARLNPTIDHYREYRRYERGAEKRVKKRFIKKVRRNLYRGWSQLDQLHEIANALIFRTQRFLDTPLPSVTKLVGKAAYSVGVLVKTIFSFVVALYALIFTWMSLDTLSERGDGWRALRDFLFGKAYGAEGGGLWSSLSQLFAEKWWYQALVFLISVLIARRVLHRLNLMDD